MIHSVLDNRYEILERIGGGGMADVYKAHDKILDRVVAVKILHAQLAGDQAFLEKFQMEAQGAARLSHPNIVNIYDVGVQDNTHYIVMEYVSGETLKEKITREGRLSVQESLKIAKEIAQALSNAHANNLVHCDVKPHNILVMEDGRVKVADFGIARAVTSTTMTYNGNVVGSVHYFSPEQAKGTKITPKSDVYSLGVVLYEMLTGEVPFIGETTVSVALKHLKEQACSMRVKNPEIPPVVEAVVFKAMSKDPKERPDARGLAEDITAAERMLGYQSENLPMADPFATQVMPAVMEADMEGEEQGATREPFYRSKKFILMTAVVLIFGFSVGVFLSFGKFWSAEEVIVPEVAGRPVALAKQLLEAANLRVNIEEVFDPKVQAGEVSKQSPDAGSSVKEQRVVTLYVSKGGEEITMPDIKGLLKAGAEEKLRKMGLALGSVYMKESDKDAGTVLEQDPASGAKIYKGKTVDVTVSRGKKIDMIAVPDFTGSSLVSAQSSLKSLGLTVGKVTKKNSTYPAGTVIGQSPKDGTAEKGSSVDFVVSDGRERQPSNGKKDSAPQAPSKQDGGGKK